MEATAFILQGFVANFSGPGIQQIVYTTANNITVSNLTPGQTYQLSIASYGENRNFRSRFSEPVPETTCRFLISHLTHKWLWHIKSHMWHILCVRCKGLWVCLCWIVTSCKQLLLLFAARFSCLTTTFKIGKDISAQTCIDRIKWMSKETPGLTFSWNVLCLVSLVGYCHIIIETFYWSGHTPGLSYR